MRLFLNLALKIFCVILHNSLQLLKGRIVKPESKKKLPVPQDEGVRPVANSPETKLVRRRILRRLGRMMMAANPGIDKKH